LVDGGDDGLWRGKSEDFRWRGGEGW
jgi:hypothetical protein